MYLDVLGLDVQEVVQEPVQTLLVHSQIHNKNKDKSRSSLAYFYLY